MATAAPTRSASLAARLADCADRTATCVAILDCSAFRDAAARIAHFGSEPIVRSSIEELRLQVTACTPHAPPASVTEMVSSLHRTVSILQQQLAVLGAVGQARCTATPTLAEIDRLLAPAFTAGSLRVRSDRELEACYRLSPFHAANGLDAAYKLISAYRFVAGDYDATLDRVFLEVAAALWPQLTSYHHDLVTHDRSAIDALARQDGPGELLVCSKRCGSGTLTIEKPSAGWLAWRGRFVLDDHPTILHVTRQRVRRLTPSQVRSMLGPTAAA